jgi:hypothetical protein
MRHPGAGSVDGRARPWPVRTVRAVSPPPIAGRPPVKLPGGGPVPPNDFTAEVKALAELLAEVVMLAADHALFPSRWALIAELALEHDSVHAALPAELIGGSAPLDANPPALSTEHIIAQLNSLHDLIEDDHARC